jgi:hypothetical protein
VASSVLPRANYRVYNTLEKKTLENAEGAMDNVEKLATQVTQNEEKQNKNSSQCVGHHYV